MFRSKLFTILGFAALVFLTAAFSEASILRVDFCGGQFSRTQPVPMISGRNGDVIVRGDLVDTITRVDAPAGVTATIAARHGGGGLNTNVALHFSVGSNAAAGNQDIKLRYALEVSGPDVFKINVIPLQVNAIAIAPQNTTIAKGSRVTIAATGTGLSSLRLVSSFQSHFTNLQNVTTGNGATFAFSGDAQSDTHLNNFSFFDSSITGKHVDQVCSFPTGSGTLNYTVGLPDLVAGKPKKVYRFTGIENCGGLNLSTTASQFCTELAGALPNPTQANPHIEQVRDIGGIIYIVTNPSAISISTPFKVQLKNGINVLKEDVINGLDAGKFKVLSYSRPENRRKLMRDINCPSCYDLNTPPFNWVDPQYTVVVDPDRAVTEATETNNTVISD